MARGRKVVDVFPLEKGDIVGQPDSPICYEILDVQHDGKLLLNPMSGGLGSFVMAPGTLERKQPVQMEA
jgi:hypothetical protein